MFIPSLNRKTSLTLILIFAAIAVFESTIVKFSSYSGTEFSTWMHLTIFILFSGIFISFLELFWDIGQERICGIQQLRGTHPQGVRYFHQFAVIITVLIVAIIVAIVAQMILYTQYSISLLRIQTYITHISSIVFLSYLIFLLSKWAISSKKNLTILFYAVHHFH